MAASIGTPVKFSVALCTWNRSEVLRKTLEQLTRLSCDGLPWELIVVDNNSTDDTPRVLEEFAYRLPLRTFTERAPGKSNAANLAVKHARGEYIVWTDDDILVEPEWLRQYAVAFERYPNADVFGGRIDPWFEGTPPRWLTKGFSSVAAVYGAMDLKLPIGPSDNFYPFGGNMALKRSAQLRHAFDPRIGPIENSSLPGEEWMLVRELRRAGSEVIWVPDARVHHYVPHSRQNLTYLRAYFRGQGAMLAKMDTPVGFGLWFGRPVWLWRQWAEHAVRARLGRLLSSPERWLASLRHSAIAWGQLQNYKREVVF